MPKKKTLKSASKRFKITGSKKFKHKKSNLRHILTKKTSGRKRKLRLKTIVSNSDNHHIKSFFPYL